MEKKELKGTKTERNLMEAFAGESQARNKYTYFASKARKDGYEQIAALFEETANNEKEHAKMWFKYLEGGAVKSTVENLKAAAEGEISRYEAAEEYGISEQTARNYMRMYRDVNRLPPKQQTPQHTDCHPLGRRDFVQQLQ